jgi:hypothetical protein
VYLLSYFEHIGLPVIATVVSDVVMCGTKSISGPFVLEDVDCTPRK